MQPARTGLRQIMSDLLRTRAPEEAVMMAWPLVCGKEVAARSQAVAFTHGKLEVEVADATWRTQLQSFAPRYLSEYEALLGPLVQSVEFKVKQAGISTQPSGSKKPAGATKSVEGQRKGMSTAKRKSNDF